MTPGRGERKFKQGQKRRSKKEESIDHKRMDVAVRPVFR